MPRPCVKQHEQPQATEGVPWNRAQCRVCWLYLNDERYRAIWDALVVYERRSSSVPRLSQRPKASPAKKGLGDTVESALSAIGITDERVSKWLGRPCGCKERRDKLNRLGAWAKRVLSGKTEDAAQHLESLVEEPK